MTNNVEYGGYLRLMFNQDISANTNQITLISPPPKGNKTTLKASDGLVVGGSTFSEDGINFVANQYVEYQYKKGELTEVGKWKLCGETLSPSGLNLAKGTDFTIDEC